MKALGVMALLLSFASLNSLAAEKSGVKLTKLEDRIRVEINGELFTEYLFKDVPRPYCYPVIGPGGVRMTRDYPMKDTPGEERDHIHHKSIWFAHNNINGYDFWGESSRVPWGKQVQQELIEVKSSPKVGIIKSRNNWVTAEGKIMCSDERTIRFHADKEMDWEVTMKASEGDITFGDDKDGMMAIRVAESMRVTKPREKGAKKGPFPRGEGHIVSSAGITDTTDRKEHPELIANGGDTPVWGTHADWVDYYGPVDGKIVGFAMFDHPLNPRHPTTWHVRDYGLFAANPFALHAFEKKPAGAGDLKVPAGTSVTFRYRIYIHEGDEKQGKVAEHYQAYAAESASK
jgi:hypothetical protein